MKIVNADVDLKIGKLIVNPAVTIDNINLIATLKDGKLQTNPLQVGFGDGTVDVNAILDAAKHSLELKISSQNIALQNLHKEFVVADAKDFGIVSGGKSEIYADLKGTGDTYRSLTDSLSGQLIVIVGQSKLQTGQLSFLTSDFVSQLLTVLKIDTKKVEAVDMKCAVVRADFNKGKITFPKGIAADTDKLTVISNGTLNLPNDKLALQLNAYRNGLADVGVVQALTNLIEIKGTLQKPQIGLDTNGAVRTIAGIMAGPAYAGAQMFLDRDPAPCYTALKGSKFESYFPKPTGVGNAAHQAYKGAGELVGDGVNMAKDAAKSGYDLGKDAAKSGYNLGKDAAQGGYNMGKDAAKDAAKILESGAKQLINNFLK